MRVPLLDTAIDHFGSLGFEGAATRAIAKASDTAMSSITYHFGGKEGLYLAAAEHVGIQIKDMHEPILTAGKAAGAKTPEDAVVAITAMIRGLAAIMLSKRSERLARFVIREQQEPTEAFDIIYRIALAPLVDLFLALLKIARPDFSDKERRTTGFLLVGQALSLRSGRACMCRVLEKQEVDQEVEDLMIYRIGVHVENILTVGSETGS